MKVYKITCEKTCGAIVEEQEYGYCANINAAVRVINEELADNLFGPANLIGRGDFNEFEPDTYYCETDIGDFTIEPINVVE